MMTRTNRILAMAIVAAWGAGFVYTSAALADGRNHCTSVGQEHWKPASQIETDLQEMGYIVTKVKVEGTCYEVKAEKDGARLKLIYDPATAILETARLK